MNGALKAAWALTGFVVLAGVVLWIGTGRAVFAVFIVLGVLTGVGAWLTVRAVPPGPRTAGRRTDRGTADRRTEEGTP